MKPKDNKVTINPNEIVLTLDSSESIAIPRSRLRTRLQLLEWTYSLIGRPGITLRDIGALIAAMFRHHGWALPPASGSHLPVTHNQKRSLQSQSSHGR